MKNTATYNEAATKNAVATPSGKARDLKSRLGSIGSGVRRVEGLVGLDAYSYLAREHVLLAQLASSFKVPAEEVPDRVAATVARCAADLNAEHGGFRLRTLALTAGG